MTEYMIDSSQTFHENFAGLGFCRQKPVSAVSVV